MLAVNGSDKADCQAHWYLLRAQGRGEVGSKEGADTLRQTRVGRIRRPKDRRGWLRGGGTWGTEAHLRIELKLAMPTVVQQRVSVTPQGCRLRFSVTSQPQSALFREGAHAECAFT